MFVFKMTKMKQNETHVEISNIIDAQSYFAVRSKC